MSASGCIASSSRRPSTYGQSSTRRFWPGMRWGSNSVVKARYFARAVGSTRASRSRSGKPTHGITMDQASTQRIR